MWLGIFPWACIKMDISYSPWNMMTSGDRHQGCVVQVQDENQEEFICLKLPPTWRLWSSEDGHERSSCILVYGGALYKSSPSESHSRKMVQLEVIKIVIIYLKWIVQFKGMILLGFLFYRSHDVSWETGL